MTKMCLESYSSLYSICLTETKENSRVFPSLFTHGELLNVIWFLPSGTQTWLAEKSHVRAFNGISSSINERLQWENHP